MPESDNILIKTISPDEAPMDLIYEADESRESVADYINRGEIYAAFAHGKVIGEYIILHTRPFTAEILNVAVEKKHRGKGIGKLLVKHAISQARANGFRLLEIRTANAGIGQMALYQKCGFSMSHIEKRYIANLYPGPIIENGIECRDMVCLSMYL